MATRHRWWSHSSRNQPTSQMCCRRAPQPTDQCPMQSLPAWLFGRGEFKCLETVDQGWQPGVEIPRRVLLVPFFGRPGLFRSAGASPVMGPPQSEMAEREALRGFSRWRLNYPWPSGYVGSRTNPGKVTKPRNLCIVHSFEELSTQLCLDTCSPSLRNLDPIMQSMDEKGKF